jgi:hypothetical protein
LRRVAALQGAAIRSRVAATPAAGIAVAKVEPERAVVGKDVADGPKNIDQVRDVFIRRLLKTDLIGMIIITQAVVRR